MTHEHRSTTLRVRLRWTVGLVLALTLLSSAVTACSHSSASKSGGSSAALRYGVIGSAKDAVYPYTAQATISESVLGTQMFDGLAALDPTGKVQMALAESMTPNADKTVWTVKLRPNVKLHSGKTFNADDVIYSFKSMADPKNQFAEAVQISFIDPNKIKKIDDLTLEFHLKQPYGPFPDALAYQRFAMIGADSTAEKPDGTGPFDLNSFSPGDKAVLTRFDDYWGAKPGFKTLDVFFFVDQSAITNAMLGGQLDVSASIPFTDAQTLKSSPNVKLLQSEQSASYLSLDMRTDIPPFNDQRVREAMRLIVNRQQIADNAFGGFAKLADDYMGNNTSCAPPNVPQRHQDIAKAKQLLAEAGQSNLKVVLPTDDAFAGMLPMAQLFAQQAKDAGVTVTVQKLDTATLLNKWLEWPFIVNVSSSPYLVNVPSFLLPGGSNNATHFNDAQFNDLARQLFATTDEAAQCKLVSQMQQIEYERGGSVIPVYPQDIAPYRSTVHGLKPDLYGRSSYQFAGVTVD